MQTVETLNEGLKRAYTLTFTAKEIEARVEGELKKMAPQVRMPGFRPGKVPANLLRKMHGPALLNDALNTTVQQGVDQLMAEKSLRPATRPQVQLDESYEEGKDAEVKVELEVLPQVPAPSIEGIKLERLTVPAADEAIDKQLGMFAGQQKRWTDAEDGYAAQPGDQVVVDFVGRTADGVAFDGGTGEDMPVEIGAGRLIPGFEDQVVGMKAGDEKTISVTFPDDYPAENLKGQPATFELKAKVVKTAGETAIDDEMAKSLGLESLEQLRGLVKGQIEQELNGLTRTHMKRKLLDQLAAGHDFEVPPSMVEAEFDQIWHQLEHEAGHEEDPEAAKAEMEKDRDDYRAIAERRVRLGLLLSEIGAANGVQVSQQEMGQLMQQAAAQYAPEDRQRFFQFIQSDPMAAAQLRAPLYEDKVVDFLFDKAEIADREVTREELEAAIEDEEGAIPHVHGPGCGHDHDHDHGAKPAKKAAAKPKKVTAKDVEPAAPGDSLVEAEPVKKAATKKAPAAKAETEEAAEAKPAKKPAAKKKAEA